MKVEGPEVNMLEREREKKNLAFFLATLVVFGRIKGGDIFPLMVCQME